MSHPLIDSQAAVARLTRSREHLRQAMQPVAAAGQHAGTASPGTGSPWWQRITAQVPAAALLLEALRPWWARHPLRIAGLLAGEAARNWVVPEARRHPLRLVLGAATVGAALMLTRPWRWALKPALSPALWAGLLPTLVGQAMRRAPRNTWAALLAALAQPAAPAGVAGGGAAAQAAMSFPER